MISPSVKRFLGFGALLFGVGLSVWGVGYIRNAFASKEWPTTNGVVDWAEVSVSERGRDKDTYTYSVSAVYRYEIDGTGFVSDRICFCIMMRSSFYRGMPEGMKLYGAGQEVTVYYKPDDPQVAVLEPGADLSTFLFLFLGLIVAFVGALGAFTTPFSVGREPLPPLSRFRPFGR